MRAGRLEGRVLVTGAAGMLGSQLCLDVPPGVRVAATDVAAELEAPGADDRYGGVDLTDPVRVEALFEAAGPLAGVIHAAAYTAVDQAESEEEWALAINAGASENVARQAAAAGVPMVLVSTDFVFDGTKRTPYGPDEPTSPLGAYGRTKLAGEERSREAHADVRVVRTQWLYGPRGKHFPGTILRLASERDELSVVADQVGSPTSTLELAPALWDVLSAGEPGVYHAACEGEASWYDFAVATLELAGDSTPVRPCTTAEFPRPAPRPAYSVLDCSRLHALRGKGLLPWREALENFLAAEERLA